MPIPSGTVELLRESNMHTISKLAINIWPAEVIAQAEINTTPAGYPIGSLSVTPDSSTDWANVKRGMLYRVFDTDDNPVTWGVTRLNPTSGTFYIDGKSRGDPGLAQRVHRQLSSGHIIKAYSYRPLWGLLSRIVDGVFYKKYDLAYDGSGINPPPVCNMGPWRQAWAENSVATLTFSAASSFAWGTKSIIGTQWSIPTSWTITGGSSSSTSFTADIPPGFYTLECSVMDTNGQVTTGIRPIWVNDDTYKPFSESGLSVIPTSDRQDRKGRNVSFEIWDAATEAEVLPMSAFHLSESPLFDNTAISTSNIIVDSYTGFNSKENWSYQTPSGNKHLSFDLLSPWTVMEKLPMVSQAILEVASPSNWTEVNVGLGTPNFILWYVLHHHSTYLDLFDYSPLPENDPPRKKLWGLNGSSLTDYLDSVGNIIGGNIGCKSDGSMLLRRNPNIENDAFRDALDVRYTWTIEDIAESLEISLEQANSTGSVKVYALRYDAPEDEEGEPVPYGSIAPGFHQAQATGSQQGENLILKSSQSQEDLNAIAGHLFAQANNPTPEITFKVARNIDIVEPASMLWHQIEMEAAQSPRGQALDMRLLPTSVERAWESANGSWIKTITVNAAPETYGQPGETLPIETGVTYPEDEEPLEEDDILLVGILVAWNSFGRLGRTFDGLEWEDIQGDIPGKVCDLAPDWNCDYIQSGYIIGEYTAWAVSTNNDSTINIWRTQDLFGDPVEWVLYHTYTAAANTPQLHPRIVTDPDEPLYIVTAWRTAGGTRVGRSTDGGDTWSGAVSVGTGIDTRSEYADADIGLCLDGAICIVCANAASEVYKPYRATSKTGSFSIVNDHVSTNSIFATRPIGIIKTDKNGNAFWASRVYDSSSATGTTSTVNYQGSTSVINNASKTVTDNIVPRGKITVSSTTEGSPSYTSSTDLQGSSPYSAVTGDPDFSISPGADAFSFASRYAPAWWGLHYTMQMNPSARSSFRVNTFGWTVQWFVSQPLFRYASTIDLGDEEVLLGVIPTDIRESIWRVRGQLLDDDYDVLWESSWETVDLDTSGWAYTVNSAFLDLGLYYYYIDMTRETSLNYAIPSGIDARYFRVISEITDTNYEITTTSWSDESFGTRVAFVTRITEMNIGNTARFDSARNLHYLSPTDYSSLPTWDDRTPEDADIPLYPYSIDLDAEVSSDPLMLAEKDTAQFYESGDTGETWTIIEEEVSYRGVSGEGDIRIAWGVGSLDYSDDGGSTYTSYIGDWADVLGDVGTIRGILF